jgi:glycosyltransferase involved in cell wall biosynthesis
MSSKRARTALIRSGELLGWRSCVPISNNLKSAYVEAFGEKNIDEFFVRASMSETQLQTLAEKIVSANPARVVFPDYLPHPGPLLRAIAKKIGASAPPEIHVHCYGGFWQGSDEWRRAESALLGLPVGFMGASTRSSKMIELFVRNPRAVSTLRFPVDCAFYRFDSGLRARLRAELALGAEERVVVYTGRISLQKNGVQVLECLRNAASALSNPLRMVFAGGFDDLGADLFGVEIEQENYRELWLRQVQKSSVEGLVISHLPNLEAHGLRDLYHRADVFFSLSLHHDEDFGMSPAEALCSGTPAVLSDWGGFADFESDRAPVRFSQGEAGLGLDASAASSALAKVLQNPYSDAQRAELAARAASSLSIEAVSVSLQRHFESSALPFEGFAPAFDPLSHAPISPQIHRDIYRAYTGES